MKTLRKKLPDNLLEIIIGIGISALGLFLLVKPGTSLITLCTIFGTVALVAGVVKAVNYVNDKKESKQSFIDIVSGIALLICAFVLLLHPKFLLSILPFFMGIAVLFYGISSFKLGGLFGKIIAIGIIAFGISLIFNPFKGATTVTSIVGFGLFIFGIVKIISSILTKKSIVPDNTDDNGYREVEFKDV